MKYRRILHPQAEADALEHKKSGNIPLLDKLKKLYAELENHPETGTGKPEKLKHRKEETWSRRILGKHRMEYKIDEENKIVYIDTLKGHYGDK